MSKKSGIPVAAAGEHYVAFRLSAMGYSVGLTRGGSQGVDLLVTDSRGAMPVAIQVKTSSSAWREYKTKPENNHWEWPVSAKVTELIGESLFYAFVDLKAGDGRPDVYIVPSAEIARRFKAGKWTMETVWLMPAERTKYLDAWSCITSRLDAVQGART